MSMRSEKIRVRYENVRPTLTTGSIGLCTGEGWISWTIRVFCLAMGAFKPKNWRLDYLNEFKNLPSHVFMVIKEKPYRGVFHNSRFRYLVWESTTLAADGFSGARIRLLSSVIKKYKGRIRLRIMNGELSSSQKLKLQDFIGSMTGIPYEQDIDDMIASATPWHSGSSSDANTNCSRLAARTLQELHILPKQPDAQEYSPWDFCWLGAVDVNMVDSHFTLGDEIEITR